VVTTLAEVGAGEEAGAADDVAGGIVPDAVGRVMVTPPERQYDWAKRRVAIVDC
jgi:hypothetical protein